MSDEDKKSPIEEIKDQEKKIGAFDLIKEKLQAKEEANDITPIFVGVSGGTASGKTSLCTRIGERFNTKISIVSLDSFYKGLSHEQHENAENYDFDNPMALDFQEATACIKQLLSGKDAEIPVYDFTTHSRTGETITMKSTPIVIFEGLYGIYPPDLRDLMDLKLFVLTPDDIRLSRRILRDTAERGRTVKEVLTQYNRFVKPAYDSHIKPLMKFADLIIPFLHHNHTAIEMLVQNLQIKLDIRVKLSEQSVTMERRFSQTEQNLMTPGQLQIIANQLQANTSPEKDPSAIQNEEE